MIDPKRHRVATNGAVRTADLPFEAQLSLLRLMPRLQGCWETEQVEPELRHEFENRLLEHWPPLFKLLYELYGSRYDFFYHLEQILLTAARAWANRPNALRKKDRQQIIEPEWFCSEQVVGGALYVDLFSEILEVID